MQHQVILTGVTRRNNKAGVGRGRGRDKHLRKSVQKNRAIFAYRLKDKGTWQMFLESRLYNWGATTKKALSIIIYFTPEGRSTWKWSPVVIKTCESNTLQYHTGRLITSASFHVIFIIFMFHPLTAEPGFLKAAGKVVKYNNIKRLKCTTNK